MNYPGLPAGEASQLAIGPGSQSTLCAVVNGSVFGIAFGPLSPSAPTLLSTDGQGQGAILHAGTSQIASASNPAITGDVLEIYCAGLGSGSPGQVIIGGVQAEILFSRKCARIPWSEPSECPRAERDYIWTHDSRTLNLPWQREQ